MADALACRAAHADLGVFYLQDAAAARRIHALRRGAGR
jgi:hypothetical protein